MLEGEIARSAVALVKEILPLEAEERGVFWDDWSSSHFSKRSLRSFRAFEG